jgi:hypothetical protein
MARPTKKEIAARKKAQSLQESSNSNLEKELQERIEKRKSKKLLKSKNIDSNDIEELITENNLANSESQNNMKKGISDEMDIPEEIIKELKDSSQDESFELNDNLPNEDFDPLKEKVIKRSYTDGSLGNSYTNDESINDINENKENITNEKENNNLDNTNEDKIKFEPFIEEPIINPQDPFDDNNSTNINVNSDLKDENVNVKKDPINPKLEDLSPAQKRKACEKTADALIAAYTNYVPLPFKYLSSFNMRKLEARHMNDELDKNMVVMDDGTTVESYCEQVNKQVEETFVITKEMQEEIREPLIDVLLENNAALTPTQRLIIAVGGQIIQMGITSIQFLRQNKYAIETFKKFHQENKQLKLKD